MFILFQVWISLVFLADCYEKKPKGISIDLIRQKTPTEQYLNAPELKKYGINFDWLYSKPPRTNDSIDMYRYLDNEFYAKVVVGHPGKTMNVALDTAWGVTWLISAECDNFKTVGCWFHNKYDHTKSSYYKPNGTKFIVNEGKYNFTGYYSYENISIAHSNVTGFSFVEMKEVPFSFLFNKADGVLGLSLRDDAGSYTPFFYTLLQQKKIVNPIFSIYLNRDTQSKRGGNVMLGFYDMKHVHHTVYPNRSVIPDTITYLDVDQSIFWQFNVDTIFLGTNKADNITLCPNGCKAFVDSSSNRIQGPPEDIAKINNIIKAKSFFFNKWRVDCDTVNKLPKIDFVLGGKHFILKGPDYVIKMTYFSVTLCLSAFSPFKNIENTWSLGGAFLAQYYSIYDVDKKQIGFVRAA